MTKSRSSEKELTAQIRAAQAYGRWSLLHEPHASAARYNRKTRELLVTLTNGAGFSFPVSLIPVLDPYSDADLAEVEVLPAGVGLHWEAIDMDLSVAGLAKYVLGGTALMRAAGAAGGASRSTAKLNASRLNGRKGGRPRKTKAVAR